MLCCCRFFRQIHLLAADRKIHVTHFCCCSCSFSFYALFGCSCTLTMYDIVMRGFACVRVWVRGCKHWTHLIAHTLCQMDSHISASRHTACSSLNARYACKLRRSHHHYHSRAVSNEIMFRVCCVLLLFSPCTNYSMEKLIRNAHTHTYESARAHSHIP